MAASRSSSKVIHTKRVQSTTYDDQIVSYPKSNSYDDRIVTYPKTNSYDENMLNYPKSGTYDDQLMVYPKSSSAYEVVYGQPAEEVYFPYSYSNLPYEVMITNDEDNMDGQDSVLLEYLMERLGAIPLR